MAEYPIRTVIQLFWAKKEAGCIHNRTSRTALAPLVFVLVCVCNRLYLYQSDQPIQLALPCGSIVEYHMELMFVNATFQKFFPFHQI